MVIGRITRKVTTVVLIVMLVPAPGMAWQPSIRHHAVATRTIASHARNSLAERVFLRAINSTEQELITGPGRPQTYLVFSVNMAVPPARPLINAGVKKWLDQFFENLKNHPVTAAAAAPVAAVNSVSASGLDKLPDSIAVDVNTADPARSMRVALDDALTKAGIDTNQGRITSKDGVVTYEGEQQDGDVVVSGRIVDGKMVLSKQFTPVTSGTAVAPASGPAAASVNLAAPVATPLSTSLVDYNTKLRESLEKTVKVITQGDTPAELYGQILVRNTYIKQLDGTVASLETLLRDPAKLDSVVSNLRNGAGAVDSAYQNMLAAELALGDLESRTRTNQKGYYDARMREAARLEAKGDAAGAQKIREDARNTAYGNFIEKQQMFFATLDQNPLLGLGSRGGSFLFQKLRNTLDWNAPNRDYVTLVKPFLETAASQARQEIIRVLAIHNAEDFTEFGSPKYERTRNAAAQEGNANGSSLPRSLTEMAEGKWDDVEKNNAVSTEITNFGLNIVAGGAWIIPGLGPFITAGVAAIQVYREGNELRIALLDAEDARKLAGTTGYTRIITAEDRVAAERGEFVFALGGALLEGAQAIKIMKGARTSAAVSGGVSGESAAMRAAVHADEDAVLKEIFDTNLAEARAAGVSEDRLTEILSRGPAGDPDVADALYLELLHHQGKQLNMPLKEYIQTKILDVRNKTGNLTEADFQYLRDKLAADPSYLDRLPDRGRLHAVVDRNGRLDLGDGFEPSLTAAQRDGLLKNPRVAQLVDEAKKSAAANAVSGLPPGSTPPRVTTQDATGTVIVQRGGQPAAATASTADGAGTVIVRPAQSGTPTVRMDPNSTALIDPNATALVDPNATNQLARNVILGLPNAIQSGQTPQQAANAVRGMSLPAEGLKQLTQTLMQQLFEGRHVPMSDLGNSSDAQPRNDVGVSIEALGVSSGVAFNVSAANNGGLPIRLQGEGIVVEPVSGPPSISQSAATPQVTVEPVEAFCLERTRPVAPPGTQYRVAPPAVQAQHHRMLDILHAAQRVNSVGLLRPDSEVKSYFNFVRQWSIWSKQENFDEKQFTEEFLNQTKKNVEARNIKFTDDMKNTVRKAAPGRWKDINAVLNEANQPKIQAAAIDSRTPFVLTASIAGTDAASSFTLYARRRDRVGEMS